MNIGLVLQGTAEGWGLMRLRYLPVQFPALSETFILDEIAALLDREHDVTSVAFRK